ncbi:hypothetical protein SAMN04488696_0641 [Methanolobus profundi]|uniref:Uncharacterized protein n=1 Tax=Methanolobus profundi TaxID=487685 RepID=A0A1I4PGF7_9EURY|nr:hypothetical protein SAMN04488696_0641 [Methanolobus profundi]
MTSQVCIIDEEIELLNELFFRIDQGGGMVWIEKLLVDKKEIYQRLSSKINAQITT